MKATQTLPELGQSIWLDNITRELLDSGQLQEYVDDYSLTGLTSTPAIFGDGWVSLEVSPLIAYASVFMSRWDVAVIDQVPAELEDTLALAVGLKTYQAYRELMDTDRWQRLENDGARMQRLLWASTSTKDPTAPNDLYLHCLGAPFTINTVPEDTLRAFYDHGHAGEAMPVDGGDANATIAAHEQAGIDVRALAAKLQADAATGFVDAWNDLMSIIDRQSAALTA